MSFCKFENNIWYIKKDGEERVIPAPPMDVQLIAYPENVEKIIVFAARSTYKGHNAKRLKEVTEKQVQKMLPIFLASGHGSVIEHGYFTFDIRNVSRALTHQLVRHRMGSVTQESQHYINYGRIMFVMPERLTKAQKKVFLFAYLNAFRAYRNLINEGYPSSEARGILPNATASRILISMNARSLYNFFGLRCCHRNTWEIKKLAWKMLKLCYKVAPILFSIAGPRCVQLGFCPEGKLSCNLYPRHPRKPFGERLK